MKRKREIGIFLKIIFSTICFLLLAYLMLIFFHNGELVSAQSGDIIFEVSDGGPAELPADGESELQLNVYLDNCNFGAPITYDSQFSLTVSTTNGQISPTFSSTFDDVFPPQLTLRAGSVPGEAVINAEATYCTPGAVFMAGVCSDMNFIDARCYGSFTVEFIEVEEVVEETQEIVAPTVALEQTEEMGEPTLEPTTEVLPTDEVENETSLASQDDLLRDLEEFLAGEGITAPTPGQIAAGGIALSTLLAGWLVLNQLSGVSAEDSLEVINAWRQGRTPTADQKPPSVVVKPASVDHQSDATIIPSKPPAPTKIPSVDNAVTIQKPPEVITADQTVISPPKQDSATIPYQPPVKPAPATVPTEDQVLQGVNDVQDLDDALKQTNKDFGNFKNSVPDSVRNSEVWKNHVEPKLNKVEELLKKGELDKARTWLDRTEELVKLRNEIDRDLDHLPSDKREAILWTERTLKALGHFASDTYQRIVVDPAKTAGGAVLPSEQAKQWNASMDELNQELSNVAQQVGELPRKAADLFTHGNMKDHAAEELNELYGERDVKVEYPDFMGRGTKKVQELWDHFIGSFK